MTIALYAGSFDPITYGHIDIINGGLEIFDKVIVGIAYNPEKKSFLPIESRIKLIKECMPNIEVYTYSGLTINFAKEHNATVLIRGLRNSTDFEYENQLAQINLTLADDIRTVFLTAKPEHAFISSSVVRELFSHKSDLSKYVPDNVANYLYKNIAQTLEIISRDAE